MQLPSDEIGISDLLQWRRCPQRFALGMQRHEGSYPGDTTESNAYGSAIHDAIHLVEEGSRRDDAVTQVWPKYGHLLDPGDLQLLRDDLDKYRDDAPLGMELLGTEMEGRVPLFTHEGRQIYFRFKLDALYRRVDDHTAFYMRDYKSSKWRRTQAEVDADPQMWAYNFAIHELYPECASLLQSYEQLRFGNLLTSKNSDQREQMRAWLTETTRALLADDTLAPKQNEWCPYCPLVLTCSETLRATRTWRARLALLAPMTKEGRRTKVMLSDEAGDLEEVLEQLPQMQQTRKHLEAVEDALKGVLERMPSEQRAEYGWRLVERRRAVLPPQALKLLHEQMGDSFYEAISVSKSAMEKVAGSGEREMMRALELDGIASTSIARA